MQISLFSPIRMCPGIVVALAVACASAAPNLVIQPPAAPAAPGAPPGGVPPAGTSLPLVAYSGAPMPLWLKASATTFGWRRTTGGWEARLLCLPNDKRIKPNQEFDVYVAGVAPKDAAAPAPDPAELVPKFQRGDDRTAPVIVVRLNQKDAELAPPDISLTLRLWPKNAPADVEHVHQDLTVEILRPSGRLKVADDPLKVQQTLWPFSNRPMPFNVWPDEAHDKVGSLLVEETGGRVPITSLSVTQTSPVHTESGSPTARLELAGPSPTIPAGKPLTLELRSTGAFPLGATEGHLRIDSPDLDAAGGVSFHVDTRVTSWCIPILSFVGFAAGFGVRKKWSGQIDRANAAKTLLRYASQVRAAYRHVQDPEFERILRENVAKLDQVTKGKTPKDELEKAHTEATQAIDGAWTKLQSDLTNASSLVDPWRALMAATPLLPAGPVEQWQKTKTAFHKATTAIANLNPSAAIEALEEMQQSHLLPLLRDLAEWRADFPDIIAVLARHPDADQEALKQWSAQWLTDFPDGAARWNLTGVDAATATDELSTHQRAFAIATKRINTAYIQQIKDAALRRTNLLRACPKQPLATDAAGKIDKATASYARAVAEAIGHPPADSTQEIIAALETLRQQWQEALLTLADQTGVQEQIKAQIAAGNFDEAVKAASGQPTMLGKAPVAAAAAERGMPSFISAPGSVITQAALAEAESGRISALRRSADTFQHRLFQLDAELSYATFWQTLVVSILFGLLAMGFFHEKWVGTLNDCLAVLFWGFATDLTVSRLTSTIDAAPFLKKFGTPPAV